MKLGRDEFMRRLAGILVSGGFPNWYQLDLPGSSYHRGMAFPDSRLALEPQGVAPFLLHPVVFQISQSYAFSFQCFDPYFS